MLCERRVDIGAWLRDLGLGRYAASFEANAIDPDVLGAGRDRHGELRVPLGHCMKLLKAIGHVAGQTPVGFGGGKDGAMTTSVDTGLSRSERLEGCRSPVSTAGWSPSPASVGRSTRWTSA